MKPGWKTTATNATGQAFEAAMKLVEALAPIVGPVVYIWSRTRIKQSNK